MSKRRFVLLILAFFVLSRQAPAQSPPPPPRIFISTFTGHQIQRVDSTTGGVTTIYSDTSTTNNSPNFLPEGIAVGPDGRIYVCVSMNNKIIRMNQDGSGVETVYQFSEAPQPQGPEGPSFDSNGDLFFNTRQPNHSGVWEIAGASSVLFGGTFSAPVNVVTASQTGSSWGEGTAFGGNFPTLTRRDTLPFRGIGVAMPGVLASTLLAPRAPAAAGDPNLLIVDRSGNRILIWNGTSVAPLIQNTEGSTVLDTPIGVAVSPTGTTAAGDIFVASGGMLKNVNHFDASGKFIETYASNFTDPANSANTDIPFWLAFDASGNLFVTTAATTGGAVGSVWQVTPSKTKTNLTAAANPGGLPVIAGIAVAQTRTFTTPGSQTFSFGTGATAHSIRFTISEMPAGISSFDVTVTAFLVAQSDQTLNSRLNPTVITSLVPVAPTTSPGPFVCDTYADPANNNCVIYDVATTLPSGTIIPSGVGEYVKWNGALLDPHLFRADNATSNFVDITVQVYQDPGVSGDSSGFSQYVVADDTSTAGRRVQVNFSSPNPNNSSSFRKTRNTVPIKFTMISNGVVLTGSSGVVPHVMVGQCSTTACDGTTTAMPVGSAGGANVGDMARFDPVKGNWIYNLDVSPSAYLPGFEYRVTVHVVDSSGPLSPDQSALFLLTP